MSYKAFLSHSKVSKEDQEFYDLKNKAAEYYRSNGVPQKIENVLNEMFWQKPDDIWLSGGTNQITYAFEIWQLLTFYLRIIIIPAVEL